MVKHAPNSGDCAKYLRLGKDAMEHNLKKITDLTGMSSDDAKELILLHGGRALLKLEDSVLAQIKNREAANLLICTILLGYGWSGFCNSWELSDATVSMLHDSTDGKTIN